MTSPDPAKQHAGEAAAELVQSGMTVGLGTGSTAVIMIRRLGERLEKEGLRFVGVPTSRASAELASSFGIPLADIDEVDGLDLNLDGADEVDSRFQMIKGRGGALLREKIVASAAKRRVFIVGADKRVDQLGLKFPVPVEVSPFGRTHTERGLRSLGAETTLRLAEDGVVPYVTDGGNSIIDCRFPSGIQHAGELDAQLRRVVGVFETGLFLGLCDALLIGGPTGAELIEVGRR